MPQPPLGADVILAGPSGRCDSMYSLTHSSGLPFFMHPTQSCSSSPPYPSISRASNTTCRLYSYWRSWTCSRNRAKWSRLILKALVGESFSTALPPRDECSRRGRPSVCVPSRWPCRRQATRGTGGESLVSRQQRLTTYGMEDSENRWRCKELIGIC